MKEIISSPLLLALVVIGLVYIVGFSLVYLKKAYTRCIEMGITKEVLAKVTKKALAELLGEKVEEEEEEEELDAIIMEEVDEMGHTVDSENSSLYDFEEDDVDDGFED